MPDQPQAKSMFDQDIEQAYAERMGKEIGVADETGELKMRFKPTFTASDEIQAEYGPGEIADEGDIPNDEYRDALINLMEMQADSELAGALGYVPCIAMAPNVEEFLAASMITKDEFRHARVVYKLLEHLGIDVSRHVHEHDLTMRIDDAADLGAKRAASDKRVNIFYYPVPTWTDFIAFNFCMDRGAGHQLEDVLECSYRPWQRVMEGIFKEEKFHIAHGDSWVKRLAEDPSTHDEMQAALNKWFPRTMNIFGRPNSPKNKLYRRLGLKKRDNEEVRKAFAAEVAERVREFGLDMPKWQRDESKMPEEAFVVG